MARKRSETVRKPSSRSELAKQQMDLWSLGSDARAAAAAPGKPTSTVSEKVAVTDGIKKNSKANAEPASSSFTKPRPPVALTFSQVVESKRAEADTPPALTRRQHQILDHLRRREQNGTHPPSLSELCSELSVASRGSLHKQVTALIDAGLVQPMARKHRGVRLTRASSSATRQVPLRGMIAAGRPIEALAQADLVPVPEHLALEADCYALRVRGDSMRDVGILDGDTVVVTPRATARNGEVVVALIDGTDATLKRIEQLPNEIRLHAENPAHPVQRYRPEQVSIQGVLVAQFRRYR